MNTGFDLSSDETFSRNLIPLKSNETAFCKWAKENSAELRMSMIGAAGSSIIFSAYSAGERRLGDDGLESPVQLLRTNRPTPRHPKRKIFIRLKVLIHPESMTFT